jgi:hypothetical protein
MRAAKNKNPEKTPKAAKKRVTAFMAANVELERPPAAAQYATRAHNIHALAAQPAKCHGRSKR